MDPTTQGRFRVLDSPRGTDELLLLEGESFDPTYVPVSGHDVACEDDPDQAQDDPDERVRGLRPGYLIDATLSWEGDEPTVQELTVRKRTLFTFADGVTGLFEAARETWNAARAEGAGMRSRVTYSTDNEPNGALYVFAEQPGAQDLFAEFADGQRPLDPLLDRVNETHEGDHEVFVLRPAGEPFVVVYIVFQKGRVLAETIRDTYDCPRPDEPLVE